MGTGNRRRRPGAAHASLGRVKALRAALVMLMLASACGGPDEAAGPGKSRPRAKAPAVCPLTGTKPQSVDASRPALAIKIDNAPVARPQAGLEGADIVYEELAEGGITRFLAVYHCSDANRVGPVRSARLVDPDLLVEYQPVLFGYSGANAIVLQKVQTTRGIIDLRHGSHGAAYERVKGRRAPQNLFTSTEKLRGLDKDTSGPPATGLVFEAEAQAASPPPGTSSPAASAVPGCAPSGAAAASGPGAAVSFAFAASNPVRYTYDAGSKTYKRFNGQTPTSAEGGGQLSAVNVVVIKVRSVPGTIRDAVGNLSPEIAVTGSGEAVVVRAGASSAGRWIRTTLDDRMQLVDPACIPIKLARGNTWIHLLPQEQSIALQ